MDNYIRLTVRILFISLFIIPPVYAKQFTVEQNNKTFMHNGVTSGSVSVKMGDEILFKNMDSVFHNVYSISKIMNFNFGVLGNGESAKIIFDKVGTVKVQCAIHPRMMIDVKVDN